MEFPCQRSNWICSCHPNSHSNVGSRLHLWPGLKLAAMLDPSLAHSVRPGIEAASSQTLCRVLKPLSHSVNSNTIIFGSQKLSLLPSDFNIRIVLTLALETVGLAKSSSKECFTSVWGPQPPVHNILRDIFDFQRWQQWRQQLNIGL